MIDELVKMDQLETGSNYSDFLDSPSSSNNSNFSSLSDYKKEYLGHDFIKHYKVNDNIGIDSLDSGILSDNSETPNNYYEIVINDLTEEIERNKKCIKGQECAFQKINKDNAELLSKLVSLQKSIQQKEMYIETLENDKSMLKQKLSNALDKNKSVVDQLVQIKDITANLQIDIIVKNEEGATIDSSLKLLQQRFRLFKSKHDDLKKELQRTINENLQLRNEKQELFMSNNWKTCKLNDYTKLEKELAQMQKQLLNMVHNENHLKFENMKLLNEIGKLKEIISSSTQNNKTIESVKLKPKVLNKKLYHRIVLLNEKCQNLRTKIEQSAVVADDLNKLNNNEILLEEIQKLETCLQVQLRKQIEQQKRYERNYGILLKNFKEQMQERRKVERHNTYLKNLHETLSVTCHDLKTLIATKDREIENYKTGSNDSSFEDSLDECEKNQKTIFNLDKQFNSNNNNQCENCIHLVEVTKRLQNAEASLKKIEMFESSSQNELQKKEIVIESLKKENQKLQSNNAALNAQRELDLNEIDMLKSHIEHLKKEQKNSDEAMSKLVAKNKDLLSKLDEEKANCLEIWSKNDQIVEEFALTEQQLRASYERQLEDLQSNLQRKTEEINELHKMKETTERNWSVKANKFQSIIIALKTQIRGYKNDIEAVQSQKFFLQRLCTDLKVALKVHINQNKILQRQVSGQFNNPCGQKYSFFKLPELPTTNVSENTFIEELLNKNISSMKNTSFNDVQESINSFKDELNVMQEHLKKPGT